VVVTDAEHAQRPVRVSMIVSPWRQLSVVNLYVGRSNGEPSVRWSLNWYIRPPFPGRGLGPDGELTLSQLRDNLFGELRLLGRLAIGRAREASPRMSGGQE
jgi:hypothetical protein